VHALDHYAGLDGLLDVAHAHLGLARATYAGRPARSRTEAAAFAALHPEVLAVAD
jgi:hypothetical protein